MALKTDGTGWTWGSNSSGMLGHNQGPTGQYSSPVQLPGTWASLSAGRITGNGIKTDGTLWAWGINEKGQLGLNESHPGSYNKSSPTQVGADTTWSTNAFGAGSMGGVNTSTFIKTDGTLWSWGYNAMGQLGHNNVFPTQYSSPTQIPGTDWGGVTFSNEFVVAHKAE